jgi:hypothetical protein
MARLGITRIIVSSTEMESLVESSFMARPLPTTTLTLESCRSQIGSTRRCKLAKKSRIDKNLFADQLAASL